MILLLATILFLGAPTTAPTMQEAPASDPAAAPAAPPSAPEKKICRSEEAATGSHFAAKRVCHTQAEWAQLDAAEHRSADEFRNHARQRTY